MVLFQERIEENNSLCSISVLSGTPQKVLEPTLHIPPSYKHGSGAPRILEDSFPHGVFNFHDCCSEATYCFVVCRPLQVFTVNSVGTPEGGSAVFLRASRANHSCQPNGGPATTVDGID